MRQTRIDRFIETYPDQLASEFRQILREFYGRNVTRRRVKQLMMEKVEIACAMVRPVRKRKKQQAESPFRPDSFDLLHHLK